MSCTSLRLFVSCSLGGLGVESSRVCTFPNFDVSTSGGRVRSRDSFAARTPVFRNVSKRSGAVSVGCSSLLAKTVVRDHLGRIIRLPTDYIAVLIQLFIDVCQW
jgi:hypothetical protein